LPPSRYVYKRDCLLRIGLPPGSQFRSGIWPFA